MPAPVIAVARERELAPPAAVQAAPIVSVLRQVNVDGGFSNILFDAANEPSMAIDPTDSNKIAIGWREFDDVGSDFRQAGIAYSVDGGATWLSPVGG